jgi:DNA segregation ATPase FtsK/SpoIIIE-like protein
VREGVEEIQRWWGHHHPQKNLGAWRKDIFTRFGSQALGMNLVNILFCFFFWGYQSRGEFIHNLDDFWLSSDLVIEHGGVGCISMDQTHDALFLNWFVGG